VWALIIQFVASALAVGVAAAEVDVTGPAAADTAGPRVTLLDDLGEGWHRDWSRKDFTWRHRNRYRARAEDGGRVLEVRSRQSAGGMYRALVHEPAPEGVLSWRWKVERPVAGEASERSGAGDDFAARVFVVFETHVLPWKHRAICYVWAAREDVGAVFPNPHSADVGTLVLRSGAAAAGTWVAESRDLRADYRAYFGRDPERISAVALMVDTDDSGDAVTAWFDDLVFTFAGELP
jgi:hypothetical protein